MAARREVDDRLRDAESRASAGQLEVAAKKDEILSLQRAGASAQARVDSLETAMNRLQEEAAGKSTKIRALEDSVAAQRAQFRRQQQASKQTRACARAHTHTREITHTKHTLSTH